MKKIIILLFLVILFGCDNSGGKVDDAVNKFESCYMIIKKNINQDNNGCFCSSIGQKSRDRYTQLLIEKFDEKHEKPALIKPSRDDNSENVKKVSMWYGGLKIDLKYKNKTWCITNVFYK